MRKFICAVHPVAAATEKIAACKVAAHKFTPGPWHNRRMAVVSDAPIVGGVLGTDDVEHSAIAATLRRINQ